MKYWLVKLNFQTQPFSFGKFHIYSPEMAVRELGRLENWRPKHYHKLMDEYSVRFTEPNGIRNMYVRIAVTSTKFPPFQKANHLALAEMAPFLNSKD